MNTHFFQEMIAPGCNANPQGERLRPGLASLASETNLLRAWERVRRNAGAAGVDGVTISDLEPQFPGLVRQLAAALVAGSYRPKPVLRVEVPKASGGRRKLGIPTVMDRVVQQAVLQVLQPVFDPRFSAQSFAYRPGRGPLDAVRHLQRRLSPCSGWVLHFDVENFFDTVPHARILAVVSGQVQDPGLLALVRDFLCSGVFADGGVTPTVQGVAQGSPLSPLLANAVLDALDQWLDARGVIFARYADDCAVLLDTGAEGERLRREVTEFLATLALRLNEKKTTLAPAAQAEFLGFAYREGRGGSCRLVIAPEALADYASAAEMRLADQRAVEFESRINSAATFMTSWLGYFGATEDRKQLEHVLALTEDLLRLSEWRRWANPTARQRGLAARRVAPELARQAAGASEGSPLFAEVLRQAFAREFFRDRGLSLAAQSAPISPSRLDYNGRLRPGPDTSETTDRDRPAAWRGDRSWCLVNSGWLGVNLQLACRPTALLSRIVSVSFEFRNHQIIIHC
jgi:group II intron reverse transcriptase/maturase